MNFDSVADEPTIFCIGEGCTAISPSSHGHLCASRFMVPLILYWVTESNRHRMLERHPASTISRLTQHIKKGTQHFLSPVWSLAKTEPKFVDSSISFGNGLRPVFMLVRSLVVPLIYIPMNL